MKLTAREIAFPAKYNVHLYSKYQLCVSPEIPCLLVQVYLQALNITDGCTFVVFVYSPYKTGKKGHGTPFLNSLDRTTINVVKYSSIYVVAG